MFGIVDRIQRIFVIFISAWEAKTQTKHWMKSCFISSQEDGNEDDESMPNQTQSIYLKRKSFPILINLYIYIIILWCHAYDFKDYIIYDYNLLWVDDQAIDYEYWESLLWIHKFMNLHKGSWKVWSLCFICMLTDLKLSFKESKNILPRQKNENLKLHKNILAICPCFVIEFMI